MRSSSLIMLSLMISSLVYGSAYSQYKLIKQEVINNQTICTYENARGDIINRTHKPKKKCATYINTDRE